MRPRLSKSKYLSGLQCLKRVYLEIHARNLASEMDEDTQAVLDAGTRVGELARKRYPGGVLVDVEYGREPAGGGGRAHFLMDLQPHRRSHIGETPREAIRRRNDPCHLRDPKPLEHAREFPDDLFGRERRLALYEAIHDYPVALRMGDGQGHRVLARAASRIAKSEVASTVLGWPLPDPEGDERFQELHRDELFEILAELRPILGRWEGRVGRSAHPI